MQRTRIGVLRTRCGTKPHRKIFQVNVAEITHIAARGNFVRAVISFVKFAASGKVQAKKNLGTKNETFELCIGTWRGFLV